MNIFTAIDNSLTRITTKYRSKNLNIQQSRLVEGIVLDIKTGLLKLNSYSVRDLLPTISFLEQLVITNRFEIGHKRLNLRCFLAPSKLRLSSDICIELTPYSTYLIGRSCQTDGLKCYLDELIHIHQLLITSFWCYKFHDKNFNISLPWVTELKQLIFRIESEKIHDFLRGVNLAPKPDDRKIYDQIIALHGDECKQDRLRAFIYTKFCQELKNPAQYAAYLLKSGGQENYNFLVLAIINELRIRDNPEFTISNVGQVNKNMTWSVIDGRLKCAMTMQVYSIILMDGRLFGLKDETFSEISPDYQSKSALFTVQAELEIMPCQECERVLMTNLTALYFHLYVDDLQNIKYCKPEPKHKEVKCRLSDCVIS